MDTQDLKNMIVLAAHEHITNASYELHMTPSALSKLLSRVEQELHGVQLFQRVSNRLSITDAGRDFVEYARGIVAEYDRMSAAMHQYAHKSNNNIHIGTYHFLLGLDLAQVLVSFTHAQPQITIETVASSSKNLISMLDKGEVEIAFILDHNMQLDFERYKVYTLPSVDDTFCFVTYHDHPLSARKFVTLEEIGNEPIIMMDKSTADYEIIMGHLNRHGVSLNIVQYTDRHEVAFDFVAFERGGTLYSEKMLAMYSYKMSNIVMIPLEPKILRKSKMIVSRKALKREAVKTFVDYISVECRAEEISELS